MLVAALLAAMIGLVGAAAPAAALTPTDQPTARSQAVQTYTPSIAAEIPPVELADLPPEAAKTVDLIKKDGPFPYPEKDGTTFSNREGILPDEDKGYYREYTVPTPGSDDRGARRIVTGGTEKTAPEHWYYTGDHYKSFKEITDAS